MKILPPNIGDDERDRVFSASVGIVELRGALITRTRPRVVARTPFNTLFNPGRVTGSVWTCPFFCNTILGNTPLLKHAYHPGISKSFKDFREVPVYPFYFPFHVNHYPLALEIRSTLQKRETRDKLSSRLRCELAAGILINRARARLPFTRTKKNRKRVSPFPVQIRAARKGGGGDSRFDEPNHPLCE